MHKLKFNLVLLLLSLCLIIPQHLSGQENRLEVSVATVDKDEVVPIQLTGFSAQHRRVLEFDLTVVGFKVTSGPAQFQLEASKNGIGGLLYDLRTSGGKTRLFGKNFSGPSERKRLHALADEVVETVREVPGIAQSKIVFRVRPRGRVGDSEIYMADYDGYAPRGLTADKTVSKDPAYSAKTGLIYYLSYMKSIPRIIMQNVNSGKRNVFAAFGGTSFGPSVSPDGQKVAVIISKDGNSELYTASANGKNWKRLTETRAPEFSPCWSPDGRYICFASKKDGRVQLYTIDANGGRMNRLSNTTGTLLTEPDWSPDGKFIAYTRQSGSTFRICVVSREDSTNKILIEGEDPSWSPNSRTLAFYRRLSNGKRVISLLDVPTKQVKDLPLSTLGSCSQPSWCK